MAMRLTGLMSGIDTESIIQELVTVKRTKVDDTKKAQKKHQWKQEAWKNLNTKVYSLYNSVGKLRYSSAYSMKKTTVSDTTKATVTASGDAVNGTQKLHVLSTAQSGYLTGGKLALRKEVTNADGTTSLEKTDGRDEDGNIIKITSGTKLSALGYTDGKDTTLDVHTTNEKGEAVTQKITLGKDSTIQDVVSALRENGLNASFDENNGRLFVSSKDTGKAADFTISASTTKKIPKTDDDGNLVKDKDGNVVMEEIEMSDDESASSKKLLGLLGLDTVNNTYDNQAVKIDGRDAVISLNGVKYTNTTNDFAINGLNVSVTGVTDDVTDPENVDLSTLDDSTAITITTTTDSQGIYDKVKDFLTEYNNIINEITKLYNADSAGSYEPLTDDEKDKMSDTEIEKWETKIKDSLLRRDTSLRTIMNSMMTAMSSPITIDGKGYSLSSFGIQTLGYLNAAKNEQNAYHIDGDPDDESTSSNADKLKSMIANDPDTVISFFSKLSQNLYGKMSDLSKSVDGYRTFGNFYDDKKMKSDYDDYTSKIAELEEKLNDYEDKWYSKFSKMETALAKMQSNSSAVTSLLGG